MDQDVRSAEVPPAPPVRARLRVRTLLLVAAWVAAVVAAEMLLPPEWMLVGMAPLVWIGLWGFYSILQVPAAGSALVSGLLATVLANLPSFLLLLVAPKTKRDLSLVYYALGWSMAFSMIAAIVYVLALGFKRGVKRLWLTLRPRAPHSHPPGSNQGVSLGIWSLSAALVIVHFVWTTALFFVFHDQHQTFTDWIRWTDWPGRSVFKVIEFRVQLAPLPKQAAGPKQPADAKKPADPKKPDNAKKSGDPKKPADAKKPADRKKPTDTKKPADAKEAPAPMQPSIVPLWLASQAFGVLFYVILGWLIGKDLEQGNPRRNDDEEEEQATDS